MFTGSVMWKRWTRSVMRIMSTAKGVSLIEWANLIEEILPEHFTEIKIEKNLEKGFDYRRIEYMRILALDSSGLVASVAVVEKIEEEEQVIAEYTVNYKKTHSQTLLPMLDTVSDMIRA